MNDLTLSLPELGEIKAMLASVLDGQPAQRWYTLAQACRLKFGDGKGGVAYQTIANNRAMQPRGGEPDAFISNRKVWSAETVRRWLDVTDQELAGYLKEIASDVAVPLRIAEAAERQRRNWPQIGRAS